MRKSTRKKVITFMALALSTRLYFNVYASEPVKTRIYGKDRYETSANIAKDGWSTSYYAVITSGENFPDSLSAGTLARKYDAPILLTNKNRLNINTKKELQRMRVKTVFIIGGNGAVSTSVENSIKSMGISVQRIWGKDRYETSIKIAKKLGNPSSLFIVTGQSYEDALSVGPIAAKRGYPIILTSKDYIPQCVKEFLNKKKFSKIYIVGDNSVISDNIARQFENYVKNYEINVERICADIKENGANKDAYERNLNIISKFEGELKGYKDVYITSGKNFADALSINALAAKKEAPIIMVNTEDNNLLKSFISKKYSHIGNINIIGGQGVIADGYIHKIINYIEDKEVTLKDENLNKAIREKLNIQNDNDRIYKSQLSHVESLDLSGYNIENISGIEHFKNLKELSLNNNKITNISPLKNMSSIEKLNLSKNEIVDIEDLRELYNLRYINLSNNYIEKMGTLDDIKSLRHINLNNNKLYFIPEFDNLKILSYLDLGNNSSLGYFGNLSYLKNLKTLKLRNTGVGTTDFLKDLEDLIELDLSKNNISDVEDFKKLNNLTKLYLNDNGITNIEPLKNLRNLQELNVWGNNIDDVDKLKNFTRLRKLTIQRSILNKDNKKELNVIYNVNNIYDEKNTYVDEYASYSDYDKKTDTNNNSFIEKEYEDDDYFQMKQQLFQFELIYGHEYNPAEVLYHSYSDYKYAKNSSELINKEKDLKRIISDEIYSCEFRNLLRKDFENIINQYGIIEKNHRMNEKIKELELQLKMSYTEEEKRKVRNKINYIYCDYRYDFYKNAVYVCERELKQLQGKLVELKIKSNYSNRERIRKIEGEVKNKNTEYYIMKENYERYSNYRNFFAAVESFFSD